MDDEMSGWLTAVDVETGEVRWKYHARFPMVAAVTTTAGGLVISGTLDGNLMFFEAGTGEIVNSIYTGAQIGGGIISYEVEGKQYIAVGSGTGMLTVQPPGAELPREGAIIVYSLESE